MRPFKSLFGWRALTPAALLCLMTAALPQARAQAKYPHPWDNPSQPIQKRVHELVSQMTLQEEVSQMMNTAPAIPRLGVPAYNWWSEGLHGIARSGYATVFPQAIGMSATFDPAAIHQMGTTVSTEARAKYNWAIRRNIHSIYFGLTLWAPNINIVRDPRWGRGQETYGEDPFLTGTMAAEYVSGLQGHNPKYLKTVATPKHFSVYNGPEPMRHKINANPSPHDMQDTYLAAFRMAIRQGHADSMMCSYNAVYGVPSCANKLLADVVRGKWGFDGYITSDCGAISDFYRPGAHGYSPDAVHAAASAVLAGTDTDCGTGYKVLPQSVQQGLISKAAIDRAVERLFTARFRLGMFDPKADVPYNSIPYRVVDSAAHRAQALEDARESMVLLKNEGGILPLENARTIAVVGPNAADLDSIEGNYNAIPSHPSLPVDGIEAAFPQAHVVYAQGSSFDTVLPVPVPRTQFRTGASSKVDGLKAQYYANASFQGKPVATRVDKQINFDWDAAHPVAGAPKNSFGVRWTGTMRVPAPGAYKMQISLTDCYPCNDVEAYTLWIDGHKVSSGATQDAPNRPRQLPAFTVDFKDTKPHSFRLDYSHTSKMFGAGITLNWYPQEQALREQAVAAAKKADVVVAVMGLSPTFVGEEMPIKIPGFNGGDRTRLSLPQTQQALLHALVATGKPVVLVLLNGSALSIDWAKQHVAAILEAWYPGEAGGEAIGETLAGQNDPGGKLPITFYTSVKDLPPFTDYSMKGRTYRYYTGTPLFPFGYGLSYTTFQYSHVHLSTSSLQAGQPLTVEAEVKNTGHVAGDAVTEVYVTPPQNGVNPLKELKGFDRVHLAPGQSRQLTFTLNPRDLSLVDEAGKRSVQPGDYSIFVGGSQPTGAKQQTVNLTIHGSKPLPE
jgi:beta-glucosidase